MPLERRSEGTVPGPAIDLTSPAETWTALPCVGESAFSDGGLRRGTDNLHARFRSPVAGRFFSVDPVLPIERTVRNPQGWNRYAYVTSNPLKFVDPTGERSFEWWRSAKATVAGWFGIKAKDLTKPGPYAVRAVPGTASRYHSPAVRQDLKANFDATGCHSCGTRIAGTKSGNPIADHQPPIRLNSENRPYELLPHCTTCSAKQGGQVSSMLRSAADFIPGVRGVMLALGLMEGGEELARSAGDAVEQRVLDSSAYQQQELQQEILHQIDE